MSMEVYHVDITVPKNVFQNDFDSITVNSSMSVEKTRSSKQGKVLQSFKIDDGSDTVEFICDMDTVAGTYSFCPFTFKDYNDSFFKTTNDMSQACNTFVDFLLVEAEKYKGTVVLYWASGIKGVVEGERGTFADCVYEFRSHKVFGPGIKGEKASSSSESRNAYNTGTPSNNKTAVWSQWSFERKKTDPAFVALLEKSKTIPVKDAMYNMGIYLLKLRTDGELEGEEFCQLFRQVGMLDHFEKQQTLNSIYKIIG